jgi:hypothetical protein
MVVLVSFTIGLVWWVSAWALGVKSFDAFMITAAMTAGAAGWYVAAPYLRSFLGREEPA